MKKFLSLLLLVCICLVPMAVHAEGVVELVIPHYKSGENVGAIFFLPQVERFNEKYAGKYHITIEELTQDLYSEKMRQLAVQGKLPALVEGGESEWLRDVVVPNGLFRDLTGFLAKYPEVDEQIPDFMREYNTTEDGKFVSVTYNVVRPVHMYYNTAMTSFSKEPGEYADWDELLAEFGDNKIAFMTGENAWTLSLVLSGIIAKEEGGAEWMKEHAVVENLASDFTVAPVVAGFAKIQEIAQKYGSANQIGAVYADAANTFMSCNAAIIANGSWMVSDFLPGSEDKWSNGFDGSTVKGAVFPGNVSLSNPVGGYGWWIPATATEDEAEAAEAFLAFMMSKEEIEAYCVAEGGAPMMFDLSDESIAKIAENNPLMASYTACQNSDTLYVPNILDCMPSSVANTGFGSLLPLLIDGTYTPEQFAQELSAMATEALED